MKKIILSLICLLVVLTGCGSKKEVNTNKIKIGATATPSGDILEFVKPILKEKGIDLEIVLYSDYVLPNVALAKKDIDANLFQHIQYFEKQKAEFNYDFANAGGLYIAPIGLYSKKYKKLSEIEEGAKILMSSSVADHGRVLNLLAKEGIITLKKGVDPTKATLDDIDSNPKKLVFDAQYEASLLPKIFESNEGDAVFINANFALANNIFLKDAILKEGTDSPYVNIVAVRSGDENKEAIKTLVEVLQSKEVIDYINKEFKGAIVPVTK